MRFNIDKKTILMGFLHAIVAFTSITVVTMILGFNLRMAFLFAGINTILFHIVTKNKLPMTLGVSGLFVGSILYVTQTFGKSYAFGGIMVAGIVYIIFGLIALKYQDKILKLFPDWLLSTVILLIGVSLLPIGVDLTTGYVGILSLTVTALVSIKGSKKWSMFAMPLGVLAGTILHAMTNGLDFSVMQQTQEFEFIMPKLNLASALTIGLIPIAVIFEMIGDTKNTGDIIGKDVFKEVGLGRIALGNGLATFVGGASSSNAYTTYSESTAFVMLSKYYNPTAQLFTGLFFIVISFFTPLINIIQVIPQEAFGGVVLYLFSMICINAIKQIAGSNVDLSKSEVPFVIMTVMFALSALTFSFGAVSISSVAIATVVGLILNIIFNRK